MKFIKNLFIALVIFIIFFCVYFFKYVDLSGFFRNLNAIKYFFVNNIFSILVISFICSSILIGVLNKKKFMSGFIAIIIFTLIALIFPSYIIFFDKEFNYLGQSNEKTIILNPKYFYKVDNYLIRANDIVKNNEYKNTILIDTVYSNKLYFSKDLVISDNSIVINDVFEINTNSSLNRDNIIFDRKHYIDYLYSSAENILFGFNFASFLNSFIVHINTNNLYFIFMIFLFLLFLSLYMISNALSSTRFVYHNILLAFFIYFVFQVIFLFVIRKYYIVLINNYFNMLIFASALLLLIIIVSVLLKIVLKFNNRKVEE